MKDQYLRNLLDQIIHNNEEDTTTEFKVNNYTPETIGEYISALSNSATLADKDYSYLIWGVEDQTKEVVGTNFNPDTEKKGNEELISWLTRMVNPSLYFSFFNLKYREKDLVVLRIPKATHQPIKFQQTEFIRVGSNKKKLKDHPEKEKQLWKKFQNLPFEFETAYHSDNTQDIFDLLDYEAYYKLLNQPIPSNQNLIMEHFSKDNLITQKDGAIFITNLGAILFAKNLDHFPHLTRKAPRVIKYNGKGKTSTQHEQIGVKGYAAGFEGLIHFINGLLPKNEIIGVALRKDIPMYPELAVRELVANALIHQDLNISGTGPVIEIFDNRMEIVNPGTPIIRIERFLDNPPKSRNENLASLMRRLGICEERGTGIDKVVAEVENFQLPAPTINLYDEHIKVTLYSYKEFKEMTKEEKIHAVYMHACLKYVEHEHVSNITLRKRFGLKDDKVSVISRLIKDAVEKELIKPNDPTTSPKHMRYIPEWA